MKFIPHSVSLRVLTAQQLWVKHENSWRQCVPWGLVEIKVLEIGSCQSMWSGEGGREGDGGNAARENNEAKSAGRINRRDDWSDSDWKLKGGREPQKKPKLIELIWSSTCPNSSAVRVSLQTANKVKCLHCSILQSPSNNNAQHISIPSCPYHFNNHLPST